MSSYDASTLRDNQPPLSRRARRAAGCYISRFKKPSQRKHRVYQPDHQDGGQVGQEEQDEAHDHHTACLMPGAEFHQAGENGSGKDDAGEQMEDPPGEANHEGQPPLDGQQHK